MEAPWRVGVEVEGHLSISEIAHSDLVSNSYIRILYSYLISHSHIAIA